MVTKGWIASAPMPRSRSRRSGDGLPRAVLTAEEVERILDAIDVTRPAGLRDRAMMELLYSSGLRRAELIHLRFEDLDTDRGLLCVRRGKGGRDRMVPVGARALHWIERYVLEVWPRHVKPRRDPGTVFISRQGGPLSTYTVTSRGMQAVKHAGVDKHATPHAWRHTAATVLLEGGADPRYVGELLGHRDITTTARYARVAIEHLKAVHELTHPLGDETAD